MVTRCENHPSPYCLHSYNKHLSDPTIIFDASGKIQSYNAEILKFLDCSEDILKEKNIKAILHDFDLEELQLFFQTSNIYSSILQTSLKQTVRIMVHTFKHLDKIYFCAQFKRSFFRALIVDDDVICRRILQRFLKNFDFAFIEAKDGLEALEKLESPQKGESIDVVLTDFMMPNMNGLEEAKTFRKKTDKNIPFILSTSEPLSFDFKEKCKKKHRFQKVLSKPLTKEKLSNALKKVDFPIKTL